MDRKFKTKAKRRKGLVFHKASKSREYYQTAWEKFWDGCLGKARNELDELGIVPSADNINETAIEIFEESADAEQIAGYYIVYHKEDALKDWKMNTEGMEFSEKDKEINKILEALYP